MTDIRMDMIRAAARNRVSLPPEEAAWLLSEYDRLQAPAADEISTEWGVLWTPSEDTAPGLHGEYEPRESEDHARAVHRMYRSQTRLVSRQVRRGQWTDVAE
jgi:hypothetical protein